MTRSLRRLAPLLLALTLGPAETAAAAQVTGGPLVGAATDTTAPIWVRADGPCQVAVRLRRADAPADAPWRTTAATPTRADADGSAVVLVDGLEPATAYAYEVLNDGAPLPGGPWTFRTLPRPGTGRVTLAFGSCANMQRQAVQPVFEAVADAHPGAFVFLGDNCYYAESDLDDPARMWARMRRQRENPSMRRLIAATPMYAQWDDHDYGPNDSDRTFAQKDLARTIFMGYWPNPSFGADGQGIYTKATLGPVDLFLLDDRWWRDPDAAPNAPSKTFLGPQQRAWLLDALAASRAPLKVIATGSQFLARYHAFESWQEARDEREAILDGIRDRGVKGVMFISGDRHLAEVVRYPAARVGYPLWDVTSSPLANTTFSAGVNIPNPDRVFVWGEANNFGWIEVDAAARTVRLELRDQAGKTLWSAEPTDLLAPAGDAATPPAPPGGKRYF
jgi:alkaline phosphatase D